MQSRRREEHITVSPTSRTQRRLELGSDSYRRTRRDGLDREIVHERNLSPHKIDGLRRGVGANKGGDGVERRDHDWHLGDRRSSRVSSRSPPIEQARQRPLLDDGVGRRSCSPSLRLRPRYEMTKTSEYYDDGQNLDSKHVYGYSHANSMVNREKHLTENRLGSGQGMLNHKLMVHESEACRSYGLAPDTGLTSQYEETGGHLPLLSRSMDLRRFEHEQLVQHRDPISSDKIPVAESYKHGEKTMLHAREVSHPTISPSYMKDYASTSQMRDHGRSSLGMSRSDILSSHHDGNHLPAYYELPRSSGKLTEPVGYSGYGQRPLMDTTRDAEPAQRNIGQQRCAYSPSRTEQGYVNSKLQVAPQGEHGYQYDDLHRRIAPHGRLNYEQAQMEYKNRELPGPFIVHPVLDRTGKDEEPYDNQRRGSINDHSALQKPKYVDYPDMIKTSIAPKQTEDYLNSGYNHVESDQRMPQEYKASYLAVSEADHSSILRSEYESQRNRGPGLQQKRFQNNPLTKHNSETHGHSTRVQDMKQGLGIHDHSDRQLKRKYIADDDIYVCDSRTIKSHKWDAFGEFEDSYEDEEWIDDEEMNVLYSSDNVGLDQKFYGKDKREYNELGMVEDFPSDDWLSAQDSVRYAQQHTYGFRKYSSQNVKSHPRSNSSSWTKPQHFFKRNAFHKQPRVWKKYHGYDENAHTNNDELSEDWISATESEPTEGSEEFNQMVQEAFFMYSKRLNVNSSVQRRYKEQGKAGSLFCIVCGRSSSKEFMDTQRLVTHAFMSHKARLRAKHLGLHKAICVLLGWDTVVPQDTITWVPQVLPNAEALAQKEDLILWPPVVIIHNVSLSDDNPQKWKVVSMETVEAFIRGKGFVRGRIKVCLGKPADQSVILVKFLGTFVGLGDAERLNKYLSDGKRGRMEFERIKSKSSKGSVLDDTEIRADKTESILYGYMGIAEDLDKLDFNSKKRCFIKSRKEIERLEKDPVRANERQ